MLLTALRVLARCWPALLAWFLAGWTVRALILHAGGYLLNVDENFGLLLLPIGILAMLVAYVGMFLSIRRELPHLDRVEDAQATARNTAPATPASTELNRWRDTVLAAILPFLLLYVAWNLVRQDTIDLYFASTVQDNFGTNAGSIGAITWVSIAVLVVAFGLRLLLGRLAGRLPNWVSLVTTYLEALWVLVALFTLRDLLGLLGAWLETRRMFAWAVDGWAYIREQFAWLGTIGDAIGWVWSQVGTLVGLPLAWLAFASIVYFGTMPRSSRPAPATVAKAAERWQRLPVWLRRLGTALSSGVLERWQPVALAARLIWRSGPITMGAYLLAFAVLTATTEWLRVLIYRLIGPHELNWWMGASDAVGLAVSAVVGVLQVALVAAAFDRALASDRAQELVEHAGDAVSAAARPGGPPTTS